MRRRLLALPVILFALLPVGASGIDPHLDRTLLPEGCPTCHRGHGEPGSPMLPGPQNQICLGCHASQADEDRQVRSGRLSAIARPSKIIDELSQPFTHHLDDHAFSRHESGVVVCTSCHSPHRGSTRRDLGTGSGRKISIRDPARFEYELCESCHGNKGVKTRNLLDISRLLDANSRSYHPVKVPATESSPSLEPEMTGTEIACTQCHGNSTPDGREGLHGSAIRFLLRAPYATVDGESESADTYRLCYSCHDRERVLDSTVFPEHRLHVVDQRASCAACHNPHGSVKNRALIRIGEETTLAGVSPSGSSGRLAFESSMAGEGSCYLTCHGFDHGPESYPGSSSPATLAPRERKRSLPRKKN